MATVEVVPYSEDQFTDVAFVGGGLRGRPLFHGAGESWEPVMVITVKDEAGAIRSRYIVDISGRTARLRLKDRSHPVPAFLEGAYSPIEDLKPSADHRSDPGPDSQLQEEHHA